MATNATAVNALSPVDWFDGVDYDSSSNTLTGIKGTVAGTYGKTPPTVSTVGSPARKVLSFGSSHALRTPFSTAYQSVFSGDCTLVLLGHFKGSGGSRIMVAGRQVSWNGLGFNVIDFGFTTGLFYSQLYDVNNASNVTTHTYQVTPTLVALRKVGLTLQILTLFDDDTVVSSTISGNGPSMADLQYFCIGGGWHGSNQGHDFDFFAGGFFPYALSVSNLVALRDAAMPPKPPPYFGGLLEWLDPTYGVGTTKWTGRQAQWDASKLLGTDPDLVARTVGGLPFVRLQRTSLGTTRMAAGSGLPGAFRLGTLIGNRILNSNGGKYAVPSAVGDWGAGLTGVGSGGSGIVQLANIQSDDPGVSVGISAVQQNASYPGFSSAASEGISAQVASSIGVHVVDAFTRNGASLRYIRSDNRHLTATVSDQSISNAAWRINGARTFGATAANSGDIDIGHSALFGRDLEPFELWQLATWMRKGITYVSAFAPEDIRLVEGVGSGLDNVEDD